MNDPVDYIISEYDQRKASRPSYSLRAFAASLDMDSGALSQIMRKKRALGPKTAQKIARNIGDMRESGKQFKALSGQSSGPYKKRGGSLKRLTREEFKVLKDWRCYALLTLLKISDNHSIDFLAERLGIDRHECQAVINHLKNLGYISMSERKLDLLDKVCSTTNVPNKDIRDFHCAKLDLAKKKLKTQDMSERDYSSITFSAQKSDFERIKQKIKKFRRDLMQEFETTKSDEVFSMSVQLFQLTKSKKRN